MFVPKYRKSKKIKKQSLEDYLEASVPEKLVVRVWTSNAKEDGNKLFNFNRDGYRIIERNFHVQGSNAIMLADDEQIVQIRRARELIPINYESEKVKIQEKNRLLSLVWTGNWRGYYVHEAGFDKVDNESSKDFLKKVWLVARYAGLVPEDKGL